MSMCLLHNWLLLFTNFAEGLPLLLRLFTWALARWLGCSDSCLIPALLWFVSPRRRWSLFYRRGEHGSPRCWSTFRTTLLFLLLFFTCSNCQQVWTRGRLLLYLSRCLRCLKELMVGAILARCGLSKLSLFRYFSNIIESYYLLGLLFLDLLVFIRARLVVAILEPCHELVHIGCHVFSDGSDGFSLILREEFREVWLTFGFH